MDCPSCKVGHLVEDSVGAQITMVCDECGAMQEGVGQFTREEGGYVGPTMSFENKYKRDVGVSHEKRRRIYLKKYYKEVKDCMTHFVPGNRSLHETAAIFFELSSTEKSHHKRKMHIAASCVFLTLRANNCNVTIDEICQVIGVTVIGVSKSLRATCKATGQDVTIYNIKQMDGKLEQIPEMKNQPELVKKAKEIIEVLELMFITTGRKRNNIAFIASFLAIVAQQSKQKRCTTLETFCKRNDFRYERIEKLVKICKDRILELKSRLPWNKNAPERKVSYHCYINDIIKHKHVFSLLQDNYDSEEEDETFLPPRYLRHTPMRYVAPKRSYDHVSTSEVIGENEIPESEMRDYIRTPEEVAEVKKIEGFLVKKDEFEERKLKPKKRRFVIKF
ncbi:transcription factor IIIB 50 kDa subunit [Ciona intestinalis]